MWCRLFRSVLEPSWKREATRAEVWLQETEAEEEVLGPSDFPGCDCRSFQAADLDDHEADCGARKYAERRAWCRGCQLGGKEPQMHDFLDCAPIAAATAAAASGSVVGDTADTSPTVGETFGSPPWGDANQLLDHIAELVDYHQFHQRSTVMFGYCTGCSWSWTAWGEFTQSTRRAHAGHVAELVMDMVQAEQRIQRKVTK